MQKSNYEILTQIDQHFFDQYRKNKLDYGYQSEIIGDLLTISTFEGNRIEFWIEANELFIAGNDLRLRFIDTRSARFMENVDYFSKLVAISFYLTEIREANKEQKQFKVNLADLPVNTIKSLELAPTKSSTYYFDPILKTWGFIGDFFAPSKNKARKAARIDRVLGILRREKIHGNKVYA